MRSLNLVGKGALPELSGRLPRLELVTHLNLGSISDPNQVKRLVQACPNATSIRGNMDGCVCGEFDERTMPVRTRRLFLANSNEETREIHDEQLFPLIYSLPHLEELSLTGFHGALSVFLPLHLHKLELDYALSWTWRDAIVQCVNLVDLLIKECNTNDVELVFTALRDAALKRYTVRRVFNGEVPNLFVQIVNCNTLDYLAIGSFCHCRRTRRLEFRRTGLTLADLESVLNCCPGVTSLVVKEFYTFDVTGREMLAHYNRCLAKLNGLLSLTLMSTSVPFLCDLLPVCPLIERLELHRGVGSKHLQHIAACKRLQSLKIVSAAAAVIPEYAMIAVIVGCPELQELHLQRLNISNHLLGAIIENRRRLVKFSYGEVAFNAGDVSAFVEEVKKYQLPATVMIKLCD